MLYYNLQDEVSERDEEENSHHSNDASLVTSEGSQSQIKWNMGPYLKHVMVKFKQGETVLNKQVEKKETKQK